MDALAREAALRQLGSNWVKPSRSGTRRLPRGDGRAAQRSLSSAPKVDLPKRRCDPSRGRLRDAVSTCGTRSLRVFFARLIIIICRDPVGIAGRQGAVRCCCNRLLEKISIFAVPFRSILIIRALPTLKWRSSRVQPCWYIR
jgi:hypothetical protein